MKNFEKPTVFVVKIQAEDVCVSSWGREIHDYDENGNLIIDTSLEIMDI